MRKEIKEKDFIRQPNYPGGQKALKNFIGQNLKYPPAALEEKIEGTVFLRYDIDYKGNVVDVKVLSGIGHGCDEEAVRLVRLLKFEVPKVHKVKVLFHKNIQIHFKMPKQPAAQPATHVQYQITEKKAVKETPETQNPAGGYHYTITW
mgnify:CR=1 FL=1